MAYSELFMTPHSSGLGFIERAGATESLGPSSAGRIVALGAAGMIDDSMLPFAMLLDLADSERDSASLVLQIPDPMSVSGTSWRRSSIAALQTSLQDAIMDLIAPVGTVRWSVDSSDTSYWLVADGRRIGNVDSAADLSGDRYKKLFFKLWETYANLPVYNSAGQEVVRYGTAQLDWDADRKLAIPDVRGRKLVAAGKGENIRNRPLGDKQGSEEVTLGVQNLPEHAHGVRQAIVGSAETVTFLTDVTANATATSTATSTATNTAVANVRAAAAEPQLPNVQVTINNKQVENHSHELDLDLELVDGGHTHIARGEFTPTAPENTGTVDVTVDPAMASLVLQDNGSSAGTRTGGGSGHNHTATVSVTPRANSGSHVHDADIAVQSRITTIVSTVPVVALTKTTAQKTITTVGSQLSNTETAGGGVPFSALDPDFAMALYIRY